MKKLLLSASLILIIFTLSACKSSDGNKGYDPRSLVAEECDHLENIDDWQPVWCDEFDTDGLPSADHWGYDEGGDGWGNNELQHYTKRDLDNAFVEDGKLNIRAIKEDHQGSEYTSARLVSKFFGDWEYARVQVRAKMPSGTGTWPAIWMLPSEWRYGDWPESGEIDIMEYVGYEPGVVHGTIHTGAYNHGLNTQIGYSKDVPMAEEEFHLYEMVWEPASIRLLIDGEQFAEFGFNPDANIGTENHMAWPFDQPFHLILNLAVGGDWGGARGVDADAFPTEMQVDYVRVFEKDYEGLSEEAPTAPSNPTLAASTEDSIRIHWEKSDHDIAVHEYEVSIDDEVAGATTLNAFNIEELEPGTSYKVGITAIDFAGNRSETTYHNIQTASQ